MAPENQRFDEVHRVDYLWAEAMDTSDEQRMFREAIPERVPEVTREELARFIREQPGDPSETEGAVLAPESALLGAPVQADRSVPPYSYGGRLFYIKPDGNWWAASAQFVGEPNILLTAAHAVRDYATGQYWTNFIFYRGYDHGQYTQGFAIDCAYTNPSWVNPPYMRNEYDYAFLRTVGSAEGALDLMAPVSDPNWTAFGYPSNYDNGEVMYTVNGTPGQVFNSQVQMVGNSMGEGASGGAWVSQGRYVISNHSFSYPGVTDAWGPVYNQETLDVFAAVRDA